MALQQAQLNGTEARVVVRERWPHATSTYTGATSAEIYDPESGVVLGRATAEEFAVEYAWVAAAEALQITE